MSSSNCNVEPLQKSWKDPSKHELRRDHSASNVGWMSGKNKFVKRESSLSEKQGASWLRRMSGFLQKRLSSPGYNHSYASPSSSVAVSEALKNIPEGDFIRRYINGERRGTQPEVICSPQGTGLPSVEIGKLSVKIIAADTGPGPGVTAVGLKSRNLSTHENDLEFIDGCDSDDEVFVDAHSSLGRNCEEVVVEKEKVTKPAIPIAGVSNWALPAPFACGISVTLYESNPYTGEHAGDPIADAYAVVARENSALLALGDGVNWGEKASLASKCAVHGCIDYLNRAFYAFDNPTVTTSDVFRGLLRSFYAAHDLILMEGGMLTTLTVAMVLPTTNSDEYVVCSCNVGDSLAYVYSPSHGVRELTEGSHDVNAMRDMRDALGALGPVNGTTPELGNLTCAMTIVKKGDIVFITSDGVSDNFDPVVGKFAVARTVSKKDKNDLEKRKSTVGRHGHLEGDGDSTLPVLDAINRYELTLLRMDDILKHGLSSAEPGDKLSDGSPSAQMLCRNFIDFSRGLTCARRRILEDPDLYPAPVENGGQNEVCHQEQRLRRRKVGEKLGQVPGKLDHASVVAYCVGYSPQDQDSQ
ncbi:unnamed protein product [Notodromas monacha]|uniref:PPM-type phosphatase domain-containing protein n=1 Tax=Notodromas monacha TaxID=399045 RepID=A0A7R9BU87_9CRUS|nr:unnamed protein product [Notodromas monacha]CAG0920780.1 unnamed protein product [Notodromas monacha]